MTTDARALQTSAVDPEISAAMAMYERIVPLRNALGMQPDITEVEIQLFAMVANRTGLDPFSRQIYLIKRKGKAVPQTGIDGYRSTAERTHQYRGSEEATFTEPCCDLAPKGHPKEARVVVRRAEPSGDIWTQTGIARWHALYPEDDNSRFMWNKDPHRQLAKCAEADGLRKAFPRVLAGLYITDEMDQAGPGDSGQLLEAAARPTAAERIAARRQAIAAIDAIPEPQEPPRAAETEYVDTVTTPAFTEAEAPLAPTCGWALQPKAGAAIPCTLGEMHAGEHSFVDEAIKTGGRVVRLDA